MNIARPRIDLAKTSFDKTRAFVRFGTRFDPDPDSPEDLYTRAVIEEQGFDGPPDVIAAEELDVAVARGETELFRGIVDDERATAAEYADRLRYGPFFVGRGRLGGGLYASTSLDEARVFAEDPSGAVLRMALKPEIRVVRADDIARMAERQQQEETRRLEAEQARARQAALEREDYGEARRVQGEYDRMLGAVAAICFDLGRYAAYLGYDALYDEGRGVYLVLNRTALRVQREDVRW